MANTFLLKKSFHTNLCRQLVEDIQLKRSNYFYFLGKITDQNTDIIVDTNKSEIDTRSEMVYFLKVAASDVSYTTRRIDWESNTVYHQYDSTVDMTAKDFYVITDEFNVYKCLDNNYSGNSTVKPTGDSFIPIRTSDGYLWKYMYSVPKYKQNKFLSELKIPVQTALSDRFYNFGAISDAIVIDGGSGYSATETNTIEVIGDGEGAVLTPVIDSNGVLYGVEITSPGTGYTHASATVHSGTGIGASVDIVLAANDFISEQSTIEQTSIDGAIYNTVITNGGTDYYNATVAFIGDGDGAAGTVLVSNGSVVGITMTDYGSGYTYVNLVISGDNLIRNPNATVATGYAILPPSGGHGKDAVSELGSTGVCIYSNIRMNSIFQSINQDFREYGIIRNIRDVYTNNLVYDSAGLFSYIVVLNTLVDIVKDEILVSGTSQYRVVDIIIAESKIVVTSITNDELIIGSTLSALNNSARMYNVTTITDVPTGNKYTGQMLFISNSDAFTFSNDQEITIKTYLNL